MGDASIGRRLGAALAQLPLTDHPLLRDVAPYFSTWLAHATANARAYGWTCGADLSATAPVAVGRRGNT